MIKNIVFDIGNVLVDFGWEAFFDSLGIPEDIKERLAKATVIGPYWNEIDRGLWSADEVLEKFVSVDPDIKPWIEKFFDNFDGMLVQRGYVKGMIIDLKRKGFKVYCLSNMSHKAVSDCAEALNFLPMLDGYVLSCNVNLIKPEKEIYDAFFKKYDLKPEECVFIDDLEANIQTAKSCGMKGIVFKDIKAFTGELNELLKNENTGENFKSSYTKGQRIGALICVALIGLLFVATLIFSFINAPWAKTVVRACLGFAIGLPVLAWIYIWLIGKLTKKNTIADFHFFEERE